MIISLPFSWNNRGRSNHTAGQCVNKNAPARLRFSDMECTFGTSLASPFSGCVSTAPEMSVKSERGSDLRNAPSLRLSPRRAGPPVVTTRGVEPLVRFDPAGTPSQPHPKPWVARCQPKYSGFGRSDTPSANCSAALGTAATAALPARSPLSYQKLGFHPATTRLRRSVMQRPPGHPTTFCACALPATA